MVDQKALKQRAEAAVDAAREQLVRLAATIHANPEVAFQEFGSAALLSSALEGCGWLVERAVGGLDTAFVARLSGGRPGPTIAILAEYDALPGLGHACGHNLIGAAAVGAALALTAVSGELAGCLEVIGAPAEEGGGGKAYLVKAGVFHDVAAAMMVHPSDKNVSHSSSLTSYKIDIEFFGRAAHAAANPALGINALEALILTYNGINSLRQHLRRDARIHGIITHGGDAPNIVPAHAAAKFYVRAADTAYAAEVLRKVRGCAEGAAQATGARLAFSEYAPRYDSLLPNPRLAEILEVNMLALGLTPDLPDPEDRLGSTDMGNVSQVVPSIHPYIAIGPLGLGAHTAEFEKAADSPEGREAMIKAAKLLAMTAIDLLMEPDSLRQVRRAFDQQKVAQEEQISAGRMST